MVGDRARVKRPGRRPPERPVARGAGRWPLAAALVLGVLALALVPARARAEPLPPPDPLSPRAQGPLGPSPYDERPGVRTYFDLVVEAGGRAGMDSAALFSGGGGLGVTWGGDEELRRGLWHGWWAVVARGRGGADTTGRAASFVDLRLIRRIAGEEHGLSLEGGGTLVVYPEIGGGGGLAVSYGTGGPAGLGLRFDATIYRTGGVLSGVAAVFSLGLVIGVAGYRD